MDQRIAAVLICVNFACTKKTPRFSLLKRSRSMTITCSLKSDNQTQNILLRRSEAEGAEKPLKRDVTKSLACSVPKNKARLLSLP